MVYEAMATWEDSGAREEVHLIIQEHIRNLVVA
jgi:hypothetical protein